jgi:hypothetical protein
MFISKNRHAIFPHLITNEEIKRPVKLEPRYGFRRNNMTRGARNAFAQEAKCAVKEIPYTCIRL